MRVSQRRVRKKHLQAKARASSRARAKQPKVAQMVTRSQPRRVMIRSQPRLPALMRAKAKARRAKKVGKPQRALPMHEVVFRAVDVENAKYFKLISLGSQS